MGYGNLFSELSRYAGAAQARDIAEREKLQAQKTAFSEMLPLHQAAARTQAEMGEEFAVRGEERATARETAKAAKTRKALAPYLSQALGIETPAQPGATMPPGGTLGGLRDPFSAPIPATVEPYAVPEDVTETALTQLMGIGRERERAKRARPVRPSMTDIRIAAQGGDKAAQAVLDAAVQEKVNIAGQIMGEKPVAPALATKITDMESLQRRLNAGVGVGEVRAARANKYLGRTYGPTAGMREGRLNQLMGGALMGTEEQNFRGAVQDIQDTLARLREGAVIPENMMRRLERFTPSLNMPPANFLSRLTLFEDEWKKVQESMRRMGTQPRKELAAKTATGLARFPGFGNSVYVEDEGEEE